MVKRAEQLNVVLLLVLISNDKERFPEALRENPHSP